MGHAQTTQTTSFTYQGKLTDGGGPANGPYDLQFRLFDALGAGSLQGSPNTVTKTGVQVTNGIFTVQLDFGAEAFPGADRFLEISVKRPGDGSYTVLGPRQPVSSTPYAVRSLSAASADRLPGLRTEANATSPNVIGGSSSNTVTGNGGTIGGGGEAGYPNRVTLDYGTVGGGVGNTASNFATVGGGAFNTASGHTSIVGGGRANDASGAYSTVGGGAFNTASGAYSIVGGGRVNIASGDYSTVGGGNSNTASGEYSAVPGGYLNIAQGNYSLAAGQLAKAEHQGTFVWSDITTPFGTRFTSTGDNQFLINATGGVGIGTNAPGARLHVGGGNILLDNNQGVFMKHTDGTKKRVLIGDSSNILRLGSGSPSGFDEIRFDVNTSGEAMTIKGSGNVGVGTTAPLGRLQVLTATDTNPSTVMAWDNRHFVIGGPQSSGGIGLSYDQTNNVGYISSLSPNAFWRNLVLQSGGGDVGIGTTSPNDKLEVNGVIRVNALGAAGGTQLCRNLSNQISSCSSSLRYKTNVAPFSSGLPFIKQLRPITFDWKQGGVRDVGFGAEDIAKISPLFVTYNEKREVEGVKYDRLSVVFVNAFHEQQSQIENLQKLIEAQKHQIDALKKLVCATNAEAAICKQ
jgi:hypothetical protein